MYWRTAIEVARSFLQLKIALISKVYPMRSHTVAAAGGMIAAHVIAMMVIIFSVLLPWGIGIDPIKFSVKFGLIAHNGLGLIMLAGILFLILWHCVHRFYCCQHDIKISLGFRGKCVLYGIPIVALLQMLVIGW